MKLIVGLGNPGKEYEKTRHNAGFMVVEAMATSGWQKSKNGFYLESRLHPNVLLIKPQLFMNKSGEAVGYACKKYGVAAADVYVIHDDLDIQLGDYKIHFGKGPKVHNGINSVISVLKSDQFWRVRMGVENRNEEVKVPGRVYVLERFGKDETDLWQAMIDKVVAELATILED